VRACALPSVDLDAIAERTPPPERWLIGDWLPVGTAGLLAGPGAVGKSFLEIIRMVCLALGLPFMGYETDACPVIGYFSEDNDQRLGRRLKMICDALDVDPRRLKGRFELVSTVGERRLIVVGDRNSFTVQPTSWLSEVHERARALAARHVSFDHAGRLTSMNRNDPNQVFDLFSHLDALASSIDGCVCMLTHPSKTDLRAGKGPQVSGAIAMIDAPRWVHSLKPVKTEDAEQFRVLTNEKPNYSKRFAIKLEENSRGVVENAGEVDPDNPAGAKSVSSRGRPSQADKTFEALRELYLSRGTPVGLDDLVRECVRRGVIAEAAGNSEAWRARRRTVRGHLFKLQRLVDERDEAFAVKPEGLAA
jgi:RecA-family ATPase